jgi:excisionase family DNA binding protein
MEQKTQLLTVAEVAERLSRSEGQIRWMVSRGTAPRSAKIGGRRYFRADEVDRYIEEAFAKGIA